MISFLKYYRQMNETFVKHFKYRDQIIEVSINEPLSKMIPDIRAIAFPDGNLVTALDTETISFPIIHYEIYRGYTSEKVSEQTFYNMLFSFDYICLQRSGTSNRFYLGESYHFKTIDNMKTDDKVIKIIDNCQKLNPDKVFILESINRRKPSRSIDEI